MWDAETGMIDTWHKYCQKQMKDQFHMLDEKLIFSNSKTGKKDYASKMLNYPLEQGEANSYDKLMSVLYSPAERHKIEWAIGSVVSGDSKRLQKFMVLYRDMGDASQICSMDDLPFKFGPEEYDNYTAFDKKDRPIFPGYKFDKGKSTYRGEEVGEGGYVYAEPGMYGNIALLDIASMHPSSIIAEDLFGPV